jgi:GNAT superfamily N-acetyltransferase
MPSVRRALVEDAALVARLRRDWASENAGRGLDDPSFEGVFAGWFTGEFHQRKTWLAVDDDRAVGMLNMLVYTRMPKPAPDPGWRPRWGYVANAYVVKAARDQGIGGLLLDACTAYAREHRFARLVLSPSERSVPFYARAGFVPATSLMVRELG